MLMTSTSGGDERVGLIGERTDDVVDAEAGAADRTDVIFFVDTGVRGAAEATDGVVAV